MDRIHLAQVPRNNQGKISYSSIPSMAVRVMVAEEELSVLQRRVKRHHDVRDRLHICEEELAGLEAHIADLEEKLVEWRALLAEA
ncbi:hypothetical protein [Endozoicomonas sp. GU-1]|uniref:hypothetical protein n=1 Tax=Endozoicomonas sp. GU-1 TaxID=3009078 RepID=UPI0022B58F58|nr:hypothetical protein [Endozoicomonas sp. GU-1]WBA80803.1 hypothetical protein O2T12_21215 [Endozoicomonas sp. GU-1]WBA88365.1 hypothetical protein O3276_10405 [Endozoicomonas sp. GU-1]